LRHHVNVHPAVVLGSSPDDGRLEKRKRPEVALALREKRRVVGLPFLKQEEPADDGRLGLDVKGVRGAIDPPARLFLGREDIQALNPDLADPERFSRPGRPGGAKRQGERQTPDQVPSSQELM
jgi:hypothetical protein